MFHGNPLVRLAVAATVARVCHGAVSVREDVWNNWSHVGGWGDWRIWILLECLRNYEICVRFVREGHFGRHS